MGGTFKVPGFRQQLDEHRLADVLGVVGVFQIGVAQAEDGIGVSLRQVFRPFRWIHFISSFKRAHKGYDLEEEKLSAHMKKERHCRSFLLTP